MLYCIVYKIIFPEYTDTQPIGKWLESATKWWGATIGYPFPLVSSISSGRHFQAPKAITLGSNGLLCRNICVLNGHENNPDIYPYL